ncbi:MAG: DUF5685 family protein [Eggerthellaceae bacterium]
MVPRLEGLDEAERERYHRAYCGLCRAIGERCGQHCRLALTYDLVFLALLLGSLYEPEEREGEGRCAPHPVKAHGFVRSACIDYASRRDGGACVLEPDDWNDDRSVRARAFAGMLARIHRAIRERNPRICEAVETGMADIGAIEAAAREAGAVAARCPLPMRRPTASAC